MKPIYDYLTLLGNFDFWILIAIVAVLGAFGGLSHKLTESKDESKTGVISYMIVGAVASLAVLYVFNPADSLKLVALSLVAGYAGKSILNAFQSKLEATINETKLNAVRSALTDMSAQLNEVQTRGFESVKSDKGEPVKLDSGIGSLKTKLDLLKEIIK